MNKTAVAQHVKRASFLPFVKDRLQRKCTCGSYTVGGECAECAKKKSSLQRNLVMGASNDPLELEADRVAEQVMITPARSKVSGASPSVQRFSEQTNGYRVTAPESVDRVLSGSGRPLEPALRQDMEQHFSHDFSGVRIHSDAASAKSARDVNAAAYTVGRDIVFDSGRFAPGMPEGRRLLAHELTHVVQQTEVVQPVIQRKTPQEQGCDGKVSDNFQLLATMTTTPPELSAALIDNRLLHGKELPKTYHVGDYLNDYMVIVDIPVRPTNEGVVLVMHCDTLETLKYDQAQESEGQLSEPEHITKAKCGTFGSGTVKTFNNCQRVVFEFDDSSKPSREYNLKDEIYFLQNSTPPTGYSPMDLEGYLGIHLQGNLCGMVKDCQESKENKSQKGDQDIVPNTLEEFEKPEDVYGRAIHEESTQSGGKMVQYQDGTIEYYNPEKTLQMTYRLYNGQYYPYANKAKIGTEIEKSVLESELGVSIR